MTVNNFRELRIWKLGREISVEVYRLTKDFPKDELFGSVQQLRRAALSIPSNIAEGFYRQKPKEFQRFLSIALGSCAELDTQLDVCSELGYIPLEKLKSINVKIESEHKMLKKLIWIYDSKP